MSAPTYLTPEGKENLERELRELKEVKRPELAFKLKEAISMGDLSENADYHDAKEQQAFLEGRIKEIETMLRNAQIIEEGDKTGVVVIGSKVTVMIDGETETFTIVGAAEANPLKGFISNESPLGAALLNRKKNAKVKVKAPDGEFECIIKKIE